MAIRISAHDAGGGLSEVEWGLTGICQFCTSNPRARESKLQDGHNVKTDLNNVSWKCLEGSGCISTPEKLG